MHFSAHWVLCLVTLVTGTSVTSPSSSVGNSGTRIERRELLFKRCHNLVELKGVNLTLECTGSDILAIHLAYFSSVFPEDCPSDETLYKSLSSDQSNSLDSQLFAGCTEDLRLTLNALCSGLNNCTLDYNAATAYFQKCDAFTMGWINVQYTCVNVKHRSAFCQQHYSNPFGYLSTPGYPSYYSPFACRWSIQAEPGQKIHLQIIDLDVREPDYLPAPANRRRKPGEPSEKCLDSLDIIDEQVRTKILCGERNSNLIEYRSLGESLSIEFTPVDFSPSRGVLMKYSLVNCPTLRAPLSGNMQRNGSFAYYSCNFDHVFEDTGLQELILYCVEDHYWNGSVPRCIPPIEHSDLLDSQRAKLASTILTNLTSGLGAIDGQLLEKQEIDNNEAYGRFSNSLWITVLLIVLLIVSVFVIFQCVSVNLKYCFNRAGNYRIDEEPTNV